MIQAFTHFSREYFRSMGLNATVLDAQARGLLDSSC